MRLYVALLRPAIEARIAASRPGRRKALRWRVFGGSLSILGGAGAYHYWKADPTQRRKLRVGVEGVVRFLRYNTLQQSSLTARPLDAVYYELRSICVGLVISLDYWWTLRGLDEV